MKVAWILKMAWRDGRKHQSRLMLFIAAIVLGIAALVAIGSFGENLEQEIDRQASTLIGADLELSSRKVLEGNAKGLVDSIETLSEDGARERQFASMVLFVKNGGSRLVQVRAMDGNYPFYGTWETRPKDASVGLKEKQQVLVDNTLLYQFNVKVGDSVQLGTKRFRIAGALMNSPGKNAISGTVAPTVIMPLGSLEETGLTQKGSRINNLFYFKLKPGIDADNLIENLEDSFEQLDLHTSTISTTKEDTGRSFSDLNNFLGLVGFIALLLGCLGVASSVHIYVQEKIMSVAVLRCLGATNKQTFLIFLTQIVSIGLCGGFIGALLGTGIQQFIPWVLKDFLPVEVGSTVSWKAVFTGSFIGLVMAVLFALFILLSIRSISPLNTLRIHEITGGNSFWDPLQGLVSVAIIIFMLVFAKIQLHDWAQTISFCLGVILAFSLLYGIAVLLMRLLRRYVSASWPYVWRQGLANLYRPNNQTVSLIVSIGLGTALVASLLFTQHILLNRVQSSAAGTQPNMVLFDIQSKQRAELLELTRKEGLPIIQNVPVVTMQLTKIKGYTVDEVRKDSALKIPLRGFGGEIRATYRDSLMDSEKITKGEWFGIKTGNNIRISLDERYAQRIGVDIGDTLGFNVQGAPISVVVGSFRNVDWNRMQTNFRVVFPRGVIDEAPQFHVLMTHTPNDSTAAYFQQQVVNRFPNVSIIDLKLILSVLDSILDKISFVIQFIGSFSVLTGIVVLIASVTVSKYQRVRENVLLRTVGASRRQLFSIAACEYFLLGLLAATSGILLALAACFLLAYFVFEAPFTLNHFVVLSLVIVVTALTVVIGLYNSRSVLNESPLAVLRKED